MLLLIIQFFIFYFEAHLMSFLMFSDHFALTLLRYDNNNDDDDINDDDDEDDDKSSNNNNNNDNNNNNNR